MFVYALYFFRFLFSVAMTILVFYIWLWRETDKRAAKRREKLTANQG